MSANCCQNEIAKVGNTCSKLTLAMLQFQHTYIKSWHVFQESNRCASFPTAGSKCTFFISWNEIKPVCVIFILESKGHHKIVFMCGKKKVIKVSHTAVATDLKVLNGPSWHKQFLKVFFFAKAPPVLSTFSAWKGSHL